MADTFRETTHKSWFSRIGRAFVGALVGAALVVVSLIFLFWNEGRAVTTARSLAEGAAAVVSLPSEAVDGANEGKLVHVSGLLTSDTQPADDEFGVTSPGVRLERKVEMYQWKEDKRSESTTKLGGGEETVTTYTYSRVWDDSAIDSSQFRQPGGHENPPIEIASRSFQVAEAELGAFRLHKAALDALDGEEPLPLRPAQADAVRGAYAGGRPVHVADGRIYLGADPASPKVGDTRVSYQVVPLETVSIVARQSGSSLEEYPTVAGDRLLLTATGDVPADKMFSDAETANTILTWMVRVIGLLVLGIAFALILAPVGVLADFVPLFGSIVRFGTGIIAIALTFAVGGAVIALAWLWYRPLLALGILLAGVVAGFLVLRLRRKPAPAAPVPQAA